MWCALFSTHSDVVLIDSVHYFRKTSESVPPPPAVSMRVLIAEAEAEVKHNRQQQPVMKVVAVK